MKSISSDFSLIFVLLGSLLNRHQRFMPVFSSESITVLGRIVNFYTKRGEVLLCPFASGHPVVPAPLVGRPFFPHWTALALGWNQSWVCRLVPDAVLATDRRPALCGPLWSLLLLRGEFWSGGV